MGRNAKLRQQRRGSSGRPVRIFNSRPELGSAAQPTPPKSWLGKVFDRFKPPSKPSQVSSQVETFEFFDHHAVLLSALAWEGHEKHGRGLLVVTDSTSSFEVEYIPRSRFRSTLRELEIDTATITAIATAIKNYRPQSDVLMAFLTQEGAIDFISMSDQEPSPPECYQLRQAELVAQPPE